MPPLNHTHLATLAALRMFPFQDIDITIHEKGVFFIKIQGDEIPNLEHQDVSQTH